MSEFALSTAAQANIASLNAYLTAPGRRDAVFARLLEAAPLVGPDEATLVGLSSPRNVYFHRIVVGDQIFPAARIQDNNILAEAARLLGYNGLDHKGGIRYHPDVTKARNAELAFEMDIKLAVTAPSFDPADVMEAAARLFQGGGKGTMRIDPRVVGAEVLANATSEYGRLFAPHLAGPNWDPIDVPAPDVNTGGREMKILLDRYSEAAGRQMWSTYTGKRIEDGGIEGRDEATARGGVIVLERILRADLNITEGDPFAGRTFVIDGFGNAGSFMAKIALQRGGRVLAFSDSVGAVKAPRPEGFTLAEIEELLRLKEEEKKQGKGVRLFERTLDRQDMLALQTDVLVLAAPDLTLTAENADRVQAKYALELGNGMTDEAADRILEAKGTKVVPDVLANAGGVIVSGYEYLQGREWERLPAGAPRIGWTYDRVLGLLTLQIGAAADAVYALSRQHSISLRRSADAKALRTLDQAYRIVRKGGAAGSDASLRDGR